MTGHCWYPEDPEDGSSPPEGFEEWRDPSGLCVHEGCAEGNRIGRLYRATRGDHMTADDLEALCNDHELVRDEFHGQLIVESNEGYVVVADRG